jgi:hypothetical protein
MLFAPVPSSGAFALRFLVLSLHFLDLEFFFFWGFLLARLQDYDYQPISPRLFIRPLPRPLVHLSIVTCDLRSLTFEEVQMDDFFNLIPFVCCHP